MQTFPPKKVRTPKNFEKNIFIPSIFLMQEPRRLVGVRVCASSRVRFTNSRELENSRGRKETSASEMVTSAP